MEGEQRPVALVDYTEHWHLDKRVPISLIMTLVIQTVAVIWFFSTLSHRVDANALAIKAVTLSATRQDQRVRTNTNAISSISATLRNIERTTERIEKKLDDKE